MQQNLVRSRCRIALGLAASIALLSGCATETSEAASNSESSEQPLATGDVSGWVYYDGASLVASRSFNSTGATNTIEHDSAGVYRVSFPGLAKNEQANGNPHVTAAGSGSERCRVSFWGNNVHTENLRVDVRCHNTAGEPADSPFVLSYVKFTGGQALSNDGAYLWEHASTSHPQNAAWQWGAVARTVQHGTGAYTVTFEGQSSGRGTMIVTAAGDRFFGDNAYCKIEEWHSDGQDTHAEVRCFAPGGAPADSFFNLRYLRRTRDSKGGNGGFAWANLPFETDYLPEPNFRFIKPALNCGASPPTIHRVAAGRYQITYPALGRHRPPGGAAHVTAYGSGSNYCKLTNWEVPADNTEAIRTGTRCFTANGALVDSQFAQTFFSPITTPCFIDVPDSIEQGSDF